jgi:hypothetical protein
MKLFAKGKILGVATRPQYNKNTGESWEKLFLVIQTPKHGGIAGQLEDSEFQLTKAQIDAGAQKRLNDLNGNEVLIEVFMMTNEFKGKTYTSWFLSGDGVPQRLNQLENSNNKLGK